MTTPDTYQNEHERARAWRNEAGYTRRELAALTGYSEGSICAFERGTFSGGRAVEPRSMQTYKLACAAIAAGVSFDWGPVAFQVRGVRINVEGQGKL